MSINLESSNKIINFAVDNLTLIIRESITPTRQLVLGFDQPPYSILGILIGCPFYFYCLLLWAPWTYYLKMYPWLLSYKAVRRISIIYCSSFSRKSAMFWTSVHSKPRQDNISEDERHNTGAGGYAPKRDACHNAQNCLHSRWHQEAFAPSLHP